MSRGDLTLFSYELLGLVGRGGASAHDLRQMERKGRIVDWAGESQYYAEPKRLARLGYLEARREPGKTRERTVYTLTEKGVAALREWGRTPLRFTPLKTEVAARLLAADLIGDEPTRESFATLRDDLADLRERIHDMTVSAPTLPHRTKYLLLAARFFGRIVDVYEELVDEVERELGSG
ncbi:MAG TPA: PadR family transcriptional regulator [Gaiellaceae bacterium]|nr:PadR family transcriptional regulator [Gaiellaceae bacterium]